MYDYLFLICLNKVVSAFCFYFEMLDKKLLQWKLTHNETHALFI